MVNTLKILSALLNYPNDELRAVAPELRAVIINKGLFSDDTERALASLIDEIATGDLYDLQERYVLLFDRTRSLSLHLFEHVHGESRDRGQAMIDLKTLYEKNDLTISASELPDFLPMFLEFLSTRPDDEIRELLGQTVHILEALGERLEKRESRYAAIFHALLEVAETRANPNEIVVEDDGTDPMDLEALDAAWEDEPVTFGPEALSGCRDGLVARLRAAKRPAAPRQTS